ncbi:choice-of-anchor Q domain-containing protein [Verrucomicrobiota bacterium]
MSPYESSIPMIQERPFTRPQALLCILAFLCCTIELTAEPDARSAKVGQNALQDGLWQIALNRAMSDIDDSMLYDRAGAPDPRVFPYWDNRLPATDLDAMASQNGTTNYCKDILTPGALLHIPGGELLRAARSAVSNAAGSGTTYYCNWLDVVSGEETNGQIAYLVVNCSGLLDANLVGGHARTDSTNVNQLDLSCLPDIVHLDQFYTNRATQAPYVSIRDLSDRNPGVTDPVLNLFVHSLDLDRDEYVVDLQSFGSPDVALRRKFNVNSLIDFTPQRRQTMEGILYEALSTPTNPVLRRRIATDVSWNIVNWLDADRIPQNSDADYPAPGDAHDHPEGGEAMPLMNEVVLTQTLSSNWVADPHQPGGGHWDMTTNQYHFLIEFWYPFLGVSSPGPRWLSRLSDYPERTSNTFYDVRIETADPVSATNVVLPEMDFNYRQFCVISSAVVTCNSLQAARAVTMRATLRLHIDEDGQGYSPPVPVDRIPDRGNMQSWLPVNMATTAESAWRGKCVDDPRSNGKWAYWIEAPATLDHPDNLGDHAGNTNGPSVCDPWGHPQRGLRQGVPIIVRNGPMRSVGDLGCIFRSNWDDEVPDRYKWFWNTIDLMHRDEGAYLLDHCTVRDPGGTSATRGLLCLNTGQREVLRALFKNMKFGYQDSTHPTYLNADSATNEVYDLVDTIMDPPISGGPRYPYRCFQDMFTSANGGSIESGGPVANGFRAVAFKAWHTIYDTAANDKVMEDPLANIVDMITFRQNLFTVVFAVKALENDGSPFYEGHAVAVLFRDAYTGAWRILDQRVIEGTPTPAHYVSVHGQGRWPFATWRQAATNIQHAVDAAENGDTVLVSNGTYQLSSEIVLAKGIHLRGLRGRSAAILQGTPSNRCLNVAHSNAVVDGFVVTGGCSTNGGGVFLSENGVLRNCVIAGNRACLDRSVKSPVDGTGGGVYCRSGGTLENCTVVSNSADRYGGGVFCDGTGAVWNCIIDHNSSPTGANWYGVGDGGTYLYCCTQPDPGGIGCITTDPGFVDAEAGDYRLLPGSQAIDRGTNVPQVAADLLGIPRPLDGNNDGTNAHDIGSYEFVHPTADSDGDGFRDATEIVLGTDPLDPDDHPASTSTTTTTTTSSSTTTSATTTAATVTTTTVSTTATTVGTTSTTATSSTTTTTVGTTSTTSTTALDIVITDMQWMPGNTAVVTWTAIDGISYYLQGCTDLTAQSVMRWTNIGQEILGPVSQAMDRPQAPRAKLYRVVRPIPTTTTTATTATTTTTVPVSTTTATAVTTTSSTTSIAGRQ